MSSLGYKLAWAVALVALASQYHFLSPAIAHLRGLVKNSKTLMSNKDLEVTNDDDKPTLKAAAQKVIDMNAVVTKWTDYAKEAKAAAGAGNHGEVLKQFQILNPDFTCADPAPAGSLLETKGCDWACCCTEGTTTLTGPQHGNSGCGHFVGSEACKCDIACYEPDHDCSR